MPQRRIGVFGGTFDPPHLGHLILAEEIREEFGLEEVYFMPCYEPPHKDREDLTDAQHRFAMVVAATLHNPSFVASPIEVNRRGKSFSIDTVRTLADEMGEDVDIVFVTGLDAFLDIQTWKDYEQLLDLCHVVVVSRPGHGFEKIGELPEWIGERVVDLRDEKPEAAGPFPDERKAIVLSNAVHLDISSTDVRTRVRAGRSVRYRVTSEVDTYIRTHCLYEKVPAVTEVVS